LYAISCIYWVDVYLFSTQQHREQIPVIYATAQRTDTCHLRNSTENRYLSSTQQHREHIEVQCTLSHLGHWSFHPPLNC